MRAYVTGSHGFVGTWLLAHLSAAGDELVHPEHEVDVTDVAALRGDMAQARPDVVYHLAARTHVGASWAEPLETLRVNVLGTAGVIVAALACDEPPTVLLVSSSEAYGEGDGTLLDETSELRPLSPYAASKAAAELVGVQAFLGRGLRVVRVRPFNHVGPGQSDRFVISAIARRIAAAERIGEASIPVGNLSARRDFTDVRDVVRAYRLLAGAGEAGEVYNVCSERLVLVEDVVTRLLELSSAEIVPVQDPDLLRPLEVRAQRGDCGRLRQLTGWRPEIALDETLAEMLDWWRKKDG